jgi:predicted tellurium resistance membrane protein TerC
MGDITDKRLLYVKGGLFVLLGTIAVGLILMEHHDLRLALLLAIAIWSFCRAYYFAFYVIQHYVDPTFRFAGLGSFIGYLRQRRRGKDQPASIPLANQSPTE